MTESRRTAPEDEPSGGEESVAEAEIIQLGTRGAAGRGSRTRPSAAARGLAGGKRPASPTRPTAAKRRPTVASAPEPPVNEPDTAHVPPPSGAADDTPGSGSTDERIPPTLDPAAVVTELVEAAGRIVEGLRAFPGEQVRRLADDPLSAVVDVAQRLGVDWHASVEEVTAFIRSRTSGTYATDEFGFDPEFTVGVYLPVLRWLARHWFRVEVRGAENLPATDAALLVSNHAGTLPLDGMVLQCIVYDEIGRHVRMLGADLIFATPYSGDLARKTGTTLACQEDAERLLSTGQLVSVYPEGFKGLGKPYADRYKLQRFGRGGFVSAAVRAQVPIVPVSVVGSEEIYPLLSTAPLLARALGLPYFPVTPTFPWLGLLGAIPLPSKWIIQFGEAITTDQLPAGAADDPMVVFNVTDQVRETIQQTLYSLLMQRRSAFF